MQVDLAGDACVKVVNQLAKWGLLPEMSRYVEEFQAACMHSHAGWRHPSLATCVVKWNQVSTQLRQVGLSLIPLPLLAHWTLLAMHISSCAPNSVIGCCQICMLSLHAQRMQT